MHRLNVNARAANAELAREVGLSPSACLARVRSLVDRGVISRFTVEVDPASSATTCRRSSASASDPVRGISWSRWRRTFASIPK
ncbi:winged helix-turn-helix transcriptional regulator [Nesterenkonia pannonica]|uniref:winged helix-turn-helix transcriptional regulator n=1 Tax=Nesterenkonia pannonica TaxID=1548602 RepID=UPI00216498A8|nr:winged helix-turn-helix transcriptional regulator [Nesterenkonia pannonica]